MLFSKRSAAFSFEVCFSLSHSLVRDTSLNFFSFLFYFILIGEHIKCFVLYQTAQMQVSACNFILTKFLGFQGKNH